MASKSLIPQHPESDRRPQKRKRVLIGARVTYGDGAHYFDCTIRDLSEAGARITLPRGQPMPSNVYLINLRDRTAHEASVKWNNGTEAGLAFNTSFALAEVTDPQLGYLKRLWLERAAR